MERGVGLIANGTASSRVYCITPFEYLVPPSGHIPLNFQNALPAPTSVKIFAQYQ